MNEDEHRFKVRSLLTTSIASITTAMALLLGAPLAQARPAPDGPSTPSIPAPVPHSLTTVPGSDHALASGSSVWTFVLIAAITAVVTVGVTLLSVASVHRARINRRPHALAA